MNTKTIEQRIQEFLQSALRNKEIIVTLPREESDCDFVVFTSRKDADEYVTHGYDSEFIQIFSQDHTSIKFTFSSESKKQVKKYGFAYWTEDPGVRYHRDGSGTSPNFYLVECKEMFYSIPKLLSSVCKFVLEGELIHQNELWSEYDQNLSE